MISLFANLEPVLLLDTVQPSPSAEPSIEKYIREQHMYMCDVTYPSSLKCLRRKWQQMYSDLFAF